MNGWGASSLASGNGYSVSISKGDKSDNVVFQQNVKITQQLYCMVTFLRISLLPVQWPRIFLSHDIICNNSNFA